MIIVDILDQNRVLIEGGSSPIRRQVMNIKRIALTNFVLPDIKRGEETAKVQAAYKSEDIDAKFAATAWGKKLDSRAKRAQQDDFGRFKVMVARMKKSKLVNAELAKLSA